MAKPEISSKNGAFFISFCSFDFNTVSPFRNIGIDLFKSLKQHSHEFITPSNSNTFLIPRTISIISSCLTSPPIRLIYLQLKLFIPSFCY